MSIHTQTAGEITGRKWEMNAELPVVGFTPCAANTAPPSFPELKEALDSYLKRHADGRCLRLRDPWLWRAVGLYIIAILWSLESHGKLVRCNGRRAPT